jgi:hypothetical protein
MVIMKRALLFLLLALPLSAKTKVYVAQSAIGKGDRTFQDIIPHYPSMQPEIGDSDEGDRGSGVMVISVPESNRSVVGAKRRWQLDFVESDHDRQACCC